MNKIVRCTCGKETTITKGSPKDKKWKYRLPYKVHKEGLAEGWYCGNPKHHFVDIETEDRQNKFLSEFTHKES